MAKLPWKPWHEVVKVRADLLSGELPMHLFAADLYEVVLQSGVREIYEQPEEFFALTYATHNLRGLVRDVMTRLAGASDKAVRQLELTYGGGKTHTLITLRHLAHDPENLPDLPAVREFRESVGRPFPKSRVAALCFDKLDIEKGCDVRDPDGKVRRLLQPWSLLAYQIAGDEGLKVLHAEGKAEERKTAPAENTLRELFAIPAKSGLGTLILLDEVLLYAKARCGAEPGFLDVLVTFFQYLTQAATKADRCCIVASLLSSEPKDQADQVGKKIVSDLYDIFQRQKEETVQPVEQADVAEVLRRRLFDGASLSKPDDWRPHVIAALKGINALDDQTAKAGTTAEKRYLQSYPFHPELTEAFYDKWASGIERFQKTRGVLRTYALALREAAKWDRSPLIGPAVFLNAPTVEGLSEAARELVSIADTIVSDGQGTKWTGIVEGELRIARRVQDESVGLVSREVEQAAMATFIHSQPPGRTARSRELALLVGPCRPDKIELEKGLVRWARTSHWLDDRHLPEKDGQLPLEWRLGNRPNLNQMQAAAKSQISDEVVRAGLNEEIGRVKELTKGASSLGVRVHTLPTKPRDIEDDGAFHYAVMPPSAASESGKPSPEACRFINETTSADKPRVYRNAVLLLAPSKDGLAAAEAAVREMFAWDRVFHDLNPIEDGSQRVPVDEARLQTLKIYRDKAKKRVPDTIRQAYCIVVTVSEKNEIHAFKLTVVDEPHFETIKRHERARVKDTAITAEALLPDGPYDLWRGEETSRRVNDLAGAFAQLPHLPKMLKAQAIVETLVDGCQRGSFVLRLPRPDRSARTWWRSRPDDSAMADPAMELVLPAAAELAELPADLVAPKALPSLWEGDELQVKSLNEYFHGGKTVHVEHGGIADTMVVPKASKAVVAKAITEAVAAGRVWLLSGPASLLAEPVPEGVLTVESRLRSPPTTLSALAVMPENLPEAWAEGRTTATGIAVALSQRQGQTLPWKTVRDAISGAIQARFIVLAPLSGAWPCDFSAAGGVRLEVAPAGTESASAATGASAVPAMATPNVRVAEAELEPSQLQDLADAIPGLLAAKAKANVQLKFRVRIELGDGSEPPSDEVVQKINEQLGAVSEGLILE